MWGGAVPGDLVPREASRSVVHAYPILSSQSLLTEIPVNALSKLYVLSEFRISEFRSFGQKPSFSNTLVNC